MRFGNRTGKDGKILKLEEQRAVAGRSPRMQEKEAEISGQPGYGKKHGKSRPPA